MNYFLEKFSGEIRIRTERFQRTPWLGWWRTTGPAMSASFENAIERAVALGSGPILQAGDLPSNLQYGALERIQQTDELRLEELERRAIFRALRESSGDKLAAARLLGIGKTTLYRKLKQYGADSTSHPQTP